MSAEPGAPSIVPPSGAVDDAARSAKELTASPVSQPTLKAGDAPYLQYATRLPAPKSPEGSTTKPSKSTVDGIVAGSNTDPSSPEQALSESSARFPLCSDDRFWNSLDLPQPSPRLTVCAFVGPPGVGKTSAARDLALRFRSYFSSRVVWVNARSVADIVSSLCVRNGVSISEAAAVALVHGFGSSSAHRWLVVYDGADTPDVLDALFTRFLPDSDKNVHVTITSRIDPLLLGLTGGRECKVLNVATLDVTDGCALLLWAAMQANNSRRAGALSYDAIYLMASDVPLDSRAAEWLDGWRCVASDSALGKEGAVAQLAAVRALVGPEMLGGRPDVIARAGGEISRLDGVGATRFAHYLGLLRRPGAIAELLSRVALPVSSPAHPVGAVEPLRRAIEARRLLLEVQHGDAWDGPRIASFNAHLVCAAVAALRVTELAARKRTRSSRIAKHVHSTEQPPAIVLGSIQLVLLAMRGDSAESLSRPDVAFLLESQQGLEALLDSLIDPLEAAGSEESSETASYTAYGILPRLCELLIDLASALGSSTTDPSPLVAGTVDLNIASHSVTELVSYLALPSALLAKVAWLARARSQASLALSSFPSSSRRRPALNSQPSTAQLVADAVAGMSLALGAILSVYSCPEPRIDTELLRDCLDELVRMSDILSGQLEKAHRATSLLEFPMHTIDGLLPDLRGLLVDLSSSVGVAAGADAPVSDAATGGGGGASSAASAPPLTDDTTSAPNLEKPQASSVASEIRRPLAAPVIVEVPPPAAVSAEQAPSAVSAESILDRALDGSADGDAPVRVMPALLQSESHVSASVIVSPSPRRISGPVAGTCAAFSEPATAPVAQIRVATASQGPLAEVPPDPALFASAQARLEAKVLRCWLVSPAVVCWLAWFGHPLAQPAAASAPSQHASSAVSTARDVSDDDPTPAGAVAVANPASAPCAVLDTNLGFVGDSSSSATVGVVEYEAGQPAAKPSISSSSSSSSPARGGVNRSDAAATITSEVSLLRSADGDMSMQSVVTLRADQRIVLRSDGVFFVNDAPSDVVPVCASVPLADFERSVKAFVDGVDDGLRLAREFHAYDVQGCSIVAQQSGAPARVATDGPMSTPMGPPRQVDASPIYSSGSTYEPSEAVLRGDLGAVVPLPLFDRFVRSCAEPSAQAAWQLQAEIAVRGAADAAFRAVSEPSGRQLSELLASGRLAASVACAAAAALLPYATAVVASAFSGYTNGGCAGAWAGFLPRAQAEEMLLAQAARDGPGVYLLRLSGSRACEIAVSYVVTASSASGAVDAMSTGSARSGGGGASHTHTVEGLRVLHEILQLSLGGNGVMLRSKEYPAPAQAVCANRSFLKMPCLPASLAVVGWALPAPRSETGGGKQAVAVGPTALKPFGEFMKSAKAEASIALALLRRGGGLSLLSHVGSGLPLLARALYGSSAAGSAIPSVLSSTITELIEACDNDPAFSGRLRLPDGAFGHIRDRAAAALRSTHALPGISSPASLAATAWTGPLPVPPPDVLPTAAPFSSSSKNTPRRFAFSGFHGALIYTQTLARLKGKPPGSYLLRASQSQRGSAVLAFVDSAGNVQQSIISPDPSPASSGTGKVLCSGNTFPSLLSVILAYSIPPSADAPALLKAAVPPASEKVAVKAVDVTGAFTSPMSFERTRAVVAGDLEP